MRFRFGLLNLIILIIMLILLKICVTATYQYYSVAYNFDDHAALQISELSDATRMFLSSTPESFQINQIKNNFPLIQIQEVQNKFIKNPIETTHSNPNFPLTSLKEKQKLTEQLIQTGQLNISIYSSKLNKTLLFATRYKLPNRWIIPTTLLLIAFLIIIFIWAMFFRYYHYSLPEKLLNYLTEKSRQKGHKQAKTIEALSDKIRKYYDEKNIMLTALSHDIKTPLTEALLELELLEDPLLTNALREKLLKINNIINSSLEYSREPEKIHRKPVDIIRWIHPIIQNYQKFGVNIKLLNPPKNILIWPIETALFQRMIQNLIDNAKKYSEHIEISLSLIQKTGELIINISDDGPGIPEAQLDQIGTPFFRPDPSRSKKTGGSGLGLAIVKKIVALHHGQIQIKNLTPNGLSIKLIFQPASSANTTLKMIHQ